MTRMEAITRVLEAGIKRFESGKSISINGILFSNYDRNCHMEVKYNKNETIYSVHILNNRHIVALVMAADVTRVTVNNDNVIITSDILHSTFGHVNGEEINIKEYE